MEVRAEWWSILSWLCTQDKRSGETFINNRVGNWPTKQIDNNMFEKLGLFPRYDAIMVFVLEYSHVARAIPR